MKQILRLTVGTAAATVVFAVSAAYPEPLVLESKIALENIHGRIDHLAMDVARQRLFVAELGNDSVGVIDLKTHKTVRAIAGLREPQGIGYVSSTDTVYVANAGDGSVRLFRGVGLAAIGKIPLGDDADNVRVDEVTHRVFVGYGSGELAVIDAVARTKVADIPLKAHPEGFQLDGSGRHIFVNLPDAHEIALVDAVAYKALASWPTKDLRGNFPLALDESSGQVLAVFRHPARVGVFDEKDGRLIATFETCADSDDVFVDALRRRLYVSCGEGFVDVFAPASNGYRRLGHLATAAGARTSLFVPAIDRLFVAIRASATEPAAIWIFRPRSSFATRAATPRWGGIDRPRH